VDDLPITGLCIVEQTCPPGYVMVGLVVLHEPFSVKCLQVSTHLVRIMLLELVLLEEMGFVYVMLLFSKLSKFTSLTTSICTILDLMSFQIDKCEDNSRAEADLWKDQFFSKKVKRFLCITRVFPLAQV